MLTIKSVKLLPQDLKENYLDIEKKIFTEELTGETQKEKEDKYCSQKDAIRYLIVLEDDQIIGGVRLFKRKINYKDGFLFLGGFGGMWVRIDKRRKGIATLVLKKGMKILKQEKCDIAHLCTDIIKLKSLYSKFGFVPLGKKYTYIGKSGKKYIEKDGMIAPVNSVTKFKEILNSSEIFNIGLGNW